MNQPSALAIVLPPLLAILTVAGIAFILYRTVKALDEEQDQQR